MKKAKRIMGLLLALAMIISIIPMPTQAAKPKLSKTKATIEVGKTLKLKVSNYSGTIKWSSSNTKVATVSNGKVSAKKDGKATITAKCGSTKFTCKVTVIRKSYLKDVYSIGNRLKELGLVSGNPTEMAASMIGAEKGIKYSSPKCEIYEFDTASDAYKEMKKTGKVVIQGFNYEIEVSAINGKFIILCDEADNKEEIINAFKEMK